MRHLRPEIRASGASTKSGQLQRLESTASLPLASGGLWIGAAALQAREVDSVPLRPMLEGGIWRTLDGMTLHVVASQRAARFGGTKAIMHLSPEHIFNPAPGMTASVETTYTGGTPSRFRQWAEVETRAIWHSDRLRVEATLGARGAVVDNRSAVWGRLAGTLAVARRVAVLASVASEPAQLALGVPSSRMATLALSFMPGRSEKNATVPVPPSGAESFSVHRGTSGRYELAYHVARARRAHRVQVSGDFSSWQPIDLVETEPNVWTVLLPITHGVYRMSVRVDDEAWRAPPAVPTLDDEFDGTVGIVVIH